VPHSYHLLLGDVDRQTIHKGRISSIIMKLAFLLSASVNMAISLPSSVAASSSSIQVMVTPTAGLLQWTCFASTQISKEDCCREIAEAYLHFHTQEKSSQAVDDDYKYTNCLALIAPVPTELLGKDEEKADSLVSLLAQYSLFTVSHQESDNSRTSPAFATTNKTTTTNTTTLECRQSIQ
jgi:hypothetical protein